MGIKNIYSLLSTGHDYDFMKKLSVAGSTEGMYRYCEPGDGPQALANKLQELFDFLSLYVPFCNAVNHRLSAHFGAQTVWLD